MIQRIQSIYLLAACILCVATMSTGIAHFHTLQGEPVADMYNLWFTMADGQHDLRPWSLFVLLLIVSTLSFLDILLFRRRALQMRVASFCMILLVGWYVVYGFFCMGGRGVVSCRLPSHCGCGPSLCRLGSPMAGIPRYIA